MLGSDLHKAAREWAARGIPVFPCVAGTKHPRQYSHGFKDATTDPEIIDEWFAIDDFNVAFSPGMVGWAVLDVDPDKGGRESLEALELCHGPLPITFTVATPRGGDHYYFKGTLPRNTASRLGPGLDTRSIGGYVLVPPSTTDAGAYRVVRDAPLGDLPAWLVEAVEAQRNISVAAEVGLDRPENVSAFTHYMATRDPAVEGTVNDTGTAHVGMACDMGLSRETAWPIIVAEWGQRCVPPFGEDDKLYDCGLWFNRQNEGHPWALDPRSTEEVFTIPEEAKAARSRFYFYPLSELPDEPPPEWLVKDMIPEKSIGYFYGKTGSYKTALATALAMGVDGPVAYAIGEGQRGFKQRVKALASLLQPKHPFRVSENVPLLALGEVDEFIAELKDWRPVLLVIDTLTVMMEGKEENAVLDMGQFVSALKRINRAVGCAVLVIHHMSDKPSATAERGSSALRAGVDFAIHVEGDGKKHVAKVTVKKQRDSELPSGSRYFKATSWAQAAVMSEIDRGTYDEATGAGAGNAEIGAALVKLGAVDEDHAVETAVLAYAIYRHVEGEDEKEKETALAGLAADLKRKAWRGLQGYHNQREGKALRWFATPQPESGPDALTGA